jgi:hypothetical protein
MSTPYEASAQQPGQYGTYIQYEDSPNPAYVPESGNHEYVFPFGWATKLATKIGGTPDAQRERGERTYTVRPDGDEPPTRFYGPLDAETKRRESITGTDAVGWQEQTGEYLPGPDPRWNPPSDKDRLTSGMSPASYSFHRPFDQLSKGNGARTFNGMHFSMADHRRNYPIGEMDSAKSYRNTYRASPIPWDADTYDAPEAQTIESSVTPAVTYSPPRNYRL